MPSLAQSLKINTSMKGSKASKGNFNKKKNLLPLAWRRPPVSYFMADLCCILSYSVWRESLESPESMVKLV